MFRRVGCVRIACIRCVRFARYRCVLGRRGVESSCVVEFAYIIREFGFVEVWKCPPH